MELGARYYTAEQTQVIQAAFMSKVYTWMSGGLAITGLTAMWVASTPELISAIIENRLVFFGLIIGEVLLVGYLISVIQKISAQSKYMMKGLSDKYIHELVCGQSPKCALIM